MTTQLSPRPTLPILTNAQHCDSHFTRRSEDDNASDIPHAYHHHSASSDSDDSPPHSHPLAARRLLHPRGARSALRHEYLRSLLNSDCNSTVWTGFGAGKHATLSISIPSPAAVSDRPFAPPTSPPKGTRRRTASTGYMSLAERANAIMVADHSNDEVAVETAPSSPPELSYSKSSKSSSSSFRSSLDDESAEKLANFEDITLDGPDRDSVEDSNLKPESRPTLRRPQPKTMKSEGGRKGKGKARPSELRDVSNGSRRSYPGLQGAVNGALNAPMGRGMRRGFSSPSSPSFMMQPPPRSSSRSPSPSKGLMNGVPTSPRSLGGLTPKVSYDGGSSAPGASGRRLSWQRGMRKTVKELEAEYDELDEEVPEEAILENVPITPMPGQPRTSRTPSPQRHPSYTNLNHIPSGGAHSTLHSANVPRNAKRPSGPRKHSSGQIRSPRSPKQTRPKIPHSATATTFPPEPFGKPQRSKSWTDDLNEEARQLSAALEEYADTRPPSTDKPSVPNSAASSPPASRPSLANTGRASTGVIDMPPIQKGNVMIDPLPISKEKEAVLTRTRPSWLPPKCQKEEKKHMKEWEAMMARAQEVERKRASKQKESQEQKLELDGSIARIWEHHVLPNWDRVVAEPRTRELWWRGVTPASRGLVWQKAIGNDLALSPASFAAALARAQTLEARLAALPLEERAKSKEAPWLDAIARDVPAVFPDTGVFSATTAGASALADVLKAYALYRSDVGYVYGTHLIAGVLCLNLRPADAFVALANLLNRATPLAFLVHDTAAMARVHDFVLSALAYKHPRLHAHLTSGAIGLQAHEYLDPMFRCLFAYNLSQEIVQRLWDLYVFEGDKLLVRVAVAVLGKLEPKLYGGREEVLDLVSWRFEGRWDVGSEEEFVTAVREAGKAEGRKKSAGTP